MIEDKNIENQEQELPASNEENVQEEPQNEPKEKPIQKVISNIIDFFYEEEQPKSHTEEDENGNLIETTDEPKRSINWFKVGACSTSITLMIIGAIIMLFKKYH